jgi:Na+/H+ antiporter NhaD/arsenite permease-like protein
VSVLPPLLLLLALTLQALLPRQRVPIVVLAAALAVVVVDAFGLATTREILRGVPWDVLVILIALGAVSQGLAEAHVFERLGVLVAKKGGADPRAVVVVFGVVMYVVSGVVNNLTALLLVLPVLLVLLRLIGTTARHARWVVSVVLVSCNLGGAATPIGDFPAILLLGAGAMEFVPYLVRALPLTAVAEVVLLVVVVVVVRPDRDVPSTPALRRLTVAVVESLHRHVRLRPRLLVPTSLVLLGMLIVWITVPARTASPELVAWIVAALLLLTLPRQATAQLRHAVDVESTLFLFALFVLVGCVQHTGLVTAMAAGITTLPVPPAAQLVVFLVAAGLLTGLFSAGPSMAALLVVAHALAESVPADAVYVGLALSVCAGSSLFLTAATSGPLAQGLVERAGISDVDGKQVQLGFAQFLPTGLLGFAVIQTLAVLWGVLRLAWGS